MLKFIKTIRKFSMITAVKNVSAWLFVFALLSVYPTSALSYQVESNVIVNRNDDSGFEFTYLPIISINEKNINGNTYSGFVLENGFFGSYSDNYGLPLRQFNIAIPFNSDPVVTISPAGGPALERVRLESSLGDQSPEKVSVSGGFVTYERNSIRNLPVLVVKVYPVQYDINSQSVRLLESVNIQVDFNEIRSNAGSDSKLGTGNINYLSKAKSGFDRMLSGLVLNYENGKKWTNNPSAKKLNLAKQSMDSGDWFEFSITEEGIFEITYDDLVSAGFNPSSILPSTLKLYNHGGEILSEKLFQVNFDSGPGPKEIAIKVTGSSDGSFDSGDKIIFYGTPPENWNWNTSRNRLDHWKNVYTRENVYFLSSGGADGLRMSVSDYQPQTVNHTTGRYLAFVENELEKIFHSGSQWLMKKILRLESTSIPFSAPGYRTGTNAAIRLNVFTVTGDSVYVLHSTLKDGLSFTDRWAGYQDRTINSSMTLPGESNTLTVRNISPKVSNSVFVDWLEVEYDRALDMSSGDLKFFHSGLSGDNFAINNSTGAAVEVYNISDKSRVAAYETSSGSGTLKFSRGEEEVNTIVYAVNVNNYKSISGLTKIENSTLLTAPMSPQMIIITPEEFVNAVEVYKDFKNSIGVNSVVVSVEDIYNNFAGGNPDPTAIRHFLKFAYENWLDSENTPPEYVLLFGDGNYDYPGVYETSAKNFVPPYEFNGVGEINQFTTDDYYAYVDNDLRYTDYAMGRIPVTSVESAEEVIQKLIKYQTEPNYGPWRNNITFVADDEKTPETSDEDIHTVDSEYLANNSYIPKFMNQKKVYLMEYPEERIVTESGARKPDAEDDLIDVINQGTLIVNYVGHGNERVLAHERVLNRDTDMQRFTNEDQLFFMYIASCAFTRWDMPDEQSMGELLLTTPYGGVVGIVSSAREVFATSNRMLMQSFYKNFFIGGSETETFGKALMAAKHENSIRNSEKYHFLGDPSMNLSLPKEDIVINSITPDTLKALASVVVSGELSESSTNTNLYISAFDSKKDGLHTMLNGDNVNYKLPGSSIFKGGKTIPSGSSDKSFEMSFIVPKDITYGGSNGEVSVYSWGASGHSVGYINTLPVGGTADVAADNSGPEIELLVDDRVFIPGDLIMEDSKIKIKLTDPIGINITGEVGHKIEMTLDDSNNPINLSSSFEFYDGSHTSGEVVYSLSGVSGGTHSMKIRAWDNSNNSSNLSTEFTMAEDGNLIVEDVVNFPNPFSNTTQFTCKVNSDVEISIKIFTVRGLLVKVINNQYNNGSSFFVSDVWDGTDEDGNKIANGTYIYKLIAKSEFDDKTKRVEKIGKVVVMR